MVSYKDIIANNESLKVAGSGVVAVFLGATNGIGLGALRALVQHTDSPTCYVVGRSRARLDTLFVELKQLNDTATLIPIEVADLTLVREADKAAVEITTMAKKIDILIMSPGYITFNYDESPEGLERCQTIRYYARTRFLLTLLPLLRAAPSPRVVSVLTGGKEGPLWAADWHLKTHYGITNAAGAASSMTTLMYEELGKKEENRKVVWVHLYPGAVGDTGFTLQGMGAMASFLVRWIVQPIIRLVGYTMAEAGQRVVFAATSGRFRKLAPGVSAAGTLVQKGSDGVVGSGVYLLNGDSSVVPGHRVLEGLRKDSMGPKVEQHTMEEFERIAKM